MNNPAAQFLCLVRPVLENGDADELAGVVKSHYSVPDVAGFMRAPCPDVRQVAALAMGMIGRSEAVGMLAAALQDRETCVARAAEHALWSVWFRLGCCGAQAPFSAGVELIAQERFEPALGQLETAVGLDPDFAEARNQCAIALYMLERYEPAIRRYEEAVVLMPCHFGAIAGMGHAYVQTGCLAKALGCYRRARGLNPHMPCLLEHITGLESRLAADGPDGLPEAAHA